MTFPHEPTFAFRSHVFIAASAVAAVLALVLTSLNFTEWLLALVITGPTAGLLYCYARWLARSDGRFLSVHPRKIRGGLLFMFYAPLCLVLVLVVVAPWVLGLPDTTRFEKAAVFLAIPCVMALSAGALRGAREFAAV